MDKLRAAGHAVVAANAMSAAETVKVVVRCRPLNNKELNDGRQQIIEMDEKSGTCVVTPANNEPPKTFTFDAVYAPNTLQEVLYKQSAAHIVDSVLEGYNGTIFACVTAASPGARDSSCGAVA